MNQFLPLIKALIAALFITLSFSLQVDAQTKGMIVKPALGAGKAVLDPNGDGYVSSPSTPPGFKFNDVQESEIPYKALPLPAGEVLGDLLRGPTDGFSDFAFLFGNVDPVYTYVNNGNLLFRFRLGGIAPNSKGYSILIDTDNKFGNTGPNADPNYTVANPGFEVEIVLATGFGVRLYNVDGISSPAVGSQLVNLPYDQYAQKAIAYTTNGGSADYFYDFYIPFSEITSRIPSFTASTPVRMVANTVMSAQHSALAGPISDVGGIDDKVYAGNYAAAFTNIIQNVVASPLNTSTTSDFPAIRANAPVITGNYNSGTSTSSSPLRVTGTSTEPAGSIITVYNNGVVLGTTTVGAGGTWTYTLPTGSSMVSGDILTATVNVSGKSQSLQSNQVTVYDVAFTCNRSATPTITDSSDKGFVGTVPASVAEGSIIRIYKVGEPTAPVAGIPDIPVRSDKTWGWTCRDGITATNPNAGSGCIAGSVELGSGSYYAVLLESGKCASERSNDVCIKTNVTTATPTLTQSTITTSTKTLSGTAPAGATVTVLINNTYANRAIASGTGAWSISSLAFNVGDVVNIQAVTAGTCASARTALQLTVVGQTTAAPVVTGPIRAGATSISGTSTEPAGTVITVMRNGVSICGTSCPVVDAYGNWTLSGISSATLTAGNTITATATASGKSVSTVSNTVTVSTATAVPAIPTITGSYVEGATSVSGTGPANTNINLYIDGYFLGNVTSSGTGTWTVSGLSGSNIEKLLYAGGILSATSGVVGSNESGLSNRVTVTCSTTIPDRTKAITAVASAICSNNSALVQIANSEPGISYILRNEANTADLSSSVLGTGGNIVITSLPLTSSQTIRVAAMRGESPICGTVLMNNSVAITVNPNPQAFTVTAPNSQVCIGSKASLIVQSSQTNVNYQIRRKSDNSTVGIAVAGTGGQITLETPALTVTGVQNYYVQATSGIAPTYCGTQMSNEVTITVNALPAKDLNLEEGPSLNADGTTTIIVQNSENNVLYQLQVDGTNFGTPVAGTGSDISLLTDKVTTESRVYTVIAQNVSSGCSVILEESIVLQRINPLPVELVSFKAALKNSQVVLQWATASEKDNDRFEIERSKDGKNFTKIGSVQGMGTSSLTNNYTFTDKNPSAGTNYYRLKQIDYDGTFEFSKVVAVSAKAIASELSTKAYPNPVTDILQVTISVPVAQNAVVGIYDLNGRKVIDKSQALEAGTNNFKIPVQQLQTGLYLLKVVSEEMESTTRILKN